MPIFKKKERSKTYNLRLQGIRKRKQTEPKIIRRKEITIIRKEILKFILLFLSVLACLLSCFSHVRLFATLWTVALQASLFMGFSRQKYWSDLPFLLQGTFPTQGLNQPSLIVRQVFIFTTSKMIHKHKWG